MHNNENVMEINADTFNNYVIKNFFSVLYFSRKIIITSWKFDKW